MARKIICLQGTQRRKFLNDLITNSFDEDRLAYAALLSPQGKYIADFFVLDRADEILLDVDDRRADSLVQRLSMYKLRSDVTIGVSSLHVHGGLGEAPADGYGDPRHPQLGWRAYRGEAAGALPDMLAQRIAHLVPEVGGELDDNAYIMEMGFERLNGIDFKKGCYVGQEISARMKHKTTLRKGLARVALSSPQPAGTKVMNTDKEVGRLTSVAGLTALAFLRYDRLGGELIAGDARLSVEATLLDCDKNLTD